MYKPVRLDVQGRAVRLDAQGRAERRLGRAERRLGGAERLGRAERRLGRAAEVAELCGAAEFLGVPLTIDLLRNPLQSCRLDPLLCLLSLSGHIYISIDGNCLTT